MTAIQTLSTGSYTVTRKSAGSYDASGRWNTIATTTLSVVASVKPASGKQIESLPEAERVRESIVMYADDPLNPRTDSNEPDRVTVDGAIYEVYSVHHWRGVYREYWEALLTRVRQ